MHPPQNLHTPMTDNSVLVLRVGRNSAIFSAHIFLTKCHALSRKTWLVMLGLYTLLCKSWNVLSILYR